MKKLSVLGSNATLRGNLPLIFPAPDFARRLPANALLLSRNLHFDHQS
jgi:hypothetical protein